MEPILDGVRGALLIGKPSREFFQPAVEGFGLAPGEVAMIGDDLEADVGGAQAAGLKGKFRREELEASSIKRTR